MTYGKDSAMTLKKVQVAARLQQLETIKSNAKIDLIKLVGHPGAGLKNRP